MIWDVIIIGAGPAGLMAAVEAAAAGRRVLVLEQMPRPGLKLLATGGGRCNLTNTLPTAEFMARFGRHGRFMQPALAALDSTALCRRFAQWGVPTHAADGLHVFPIAESAVEVQRALVGAVEAAGATIRCGQRVTGLVQSANGTWTATADAGAETARAVILTSGGCSYRELGATGKGFDLTRTLGHRIEPLLPALVPLLVVEAWPKACAGINLDAVELWIDLPKLRQQRVRGEFLFTHRGISGPAALDLSGSVAAALAAGGSVPLRLNCFPDTGAAMWQQRLDAGRREHGARLVRNLLDDFLPAGLATAWADAAGAASTTAARLDRTQQQRLLELLAAAPLTVTGTEGFARAMVTRGGVALREIVPETLESRICPRLFFAGEVVDLDGPCGGFNLQWAFASGCLAGRAALAK